MTTRREGRREFKVGRREELEVILRKHLPYAETNGWLISKVAITLQAAPRKTELSPYIKIWNSEVETKRYQQFLDSMENTTSEYWALSPKIRSMLEKIWQDFSNEEIRKNRPKPAIKYLSDLMRTISAVRQSMDSFDQTLLVADVKDNGQNTKYTYAYILIDYARRAWDRAQELHLGEVKKPAPYNTSADLLPQIRAIASWDFPPLNGRRRKAHEAQPFY